jgi:hypothetical protein
MLITIQSSHFTMTFTLASGRRTALPYVNRGGATCPHAIFFFFTSFLMKVINRSHQKGGFENYEIKEYYVHRKYDNVNYSCY